MREFADMLQDSITQNRSMLCIGLDPDPKLMPISDVLKFNKSVVDATKDLVCAYKPNLAFYEALGRVGFDALDKTIDYIRSVAPSVTLIGDGKRGDIPSSSSRYATAMFEMWGFDAITVNGFAGLDSIAPFLKYVDKGVFVWCRSSNPGANEFQDLPLADKTVTIPLYQHMAQQAVNWNEQGNVGLVVGATYPDELSTIRTISKGMPVLVPGIGMQGGNLEKSIKLGLDEKKYNLILNVSRSVIYPPKSSADYCRDIRKAAITICGEINRILGEVSREWP